MIYEVVAHVRSSAADYIHWAAHYLGRCVVLAERDAKIPESDRKVLAQSCADEAMENLHEAVRRGFNDFNRLKTLTAHAPLRERAEFQQLVQELENR
jgi:hypothetical protein